MENHTKLKESVCSYEAPQSFMAKELIKNPKAVEAEKRLQWLVHRVTILKGGPEFMAPYAWAKKLSEKKAEQLLQRYLQEIETIRTSVVGQAVNLAHEVHIPRA